MKWENSDERFGLQSVVHFSTTCKLWFSLFSVIVLTVVFPQSLPRCLLIFAYSLANLNCEKKSRFMSFLNFYQRYRDDWSWNSFGYWKLFQQLTIDLVLLRFNQPSVCSFWNLNICCLSWSDRIVNWKGLGFGLLVKTGSGIMKVTVGFTVFKHFKDKTINP